MDTEIDWARELEQSFGTGDDVPVGHYVAVGHQAVRRRRATVAAAGVAAAIVVGTTWALAPGGAPRSDDAPVATEPNPTASPTSSPTSAAPEPVATFPWRKNDPPARATPDGLEIRPGAVVHERRDDLYPGKDTESAALDISYKGGRWWLVLEWDGGGSSMSSLRPEDGLFDTFDAFVRAEVANGGMTSGPADDDPGMADGLVTWRGGKLETAPRVTVVRQVPDPVPGDDSLGLVLQSAEGTTWMLLTQGGDAASWSLDTDSGWLTFDQWLADQVALQSGNPGLDLVDLAEDGTVTASAPGVVVLDQRADPDLERYGTGKHPSAVALLEWQGERWFVLAVGFPEGASVTTVAEAKAGGADTLDEFVAFMADRADQGGMR
ncbi:hypothetical protein J2X46_000944 [Nocardioides sp. BE266]|uniref:hypothetical protein n=1 Tax=Nocardioides sp. BE266 TaxID=2817725 RepID=UPI002861FAD2|nr:hypothetical protein [Nocardioides sp. BE266]MDR7251968.1 hypothetical protein [Nocardioides sp. BE266]